uniref:Uncharacterized protein n=1 Tax=Anguilla anguilla TaxID=7936 RepID=A0A0E9W6W5_ANGAN
MIRQTGLLICLFPFTLLIEIPHQCNSIRVVSAHRSIYSYEKISQSWYVITF